MSSATWDPEALDSSPLVEFSWAGDDDGSPVSVRQEEKGLAQRPQPLAVGVDGFGRILPPRAEHLRPYANVITVST